MNIAAMCEPVHALYPTMASSAATSPPQQRLPSLPSLSRLKSTLPAQTSNQQPDQHAFSSQHPQPSSSSFPEPRQVLPQRLDSMSSIASTSQGLSQQQQLAQQQQLSQQQQLAQPQPTQQRHQENNTMRRGSSAFSSQANTQTRHRGKQTKAACIPCRKRKSKCDGIRPSCKSCSSKATPCAYSVIPGVTQQQAVKNQLDAYKYVLNLLREGNKDDCDKLVLEIKKGESLTDAILEIGGREKESWVR
ncbi:hypothetical protein AUEXF2481DRAFT_450932 [Aureobasidium subglaciale EXF-2481]|uniref:Zn(2)-C6 fungal-type domain-containing protein n=1 Tax=Aureobasidium subglaciale (strain EXF-2481) TaxID=1043005 RepID=A0A074Y219_AURSE|nr:uncharacterized protein AUEXF2481DRAFT_450932 [Aureobasidium subglaciale EXF-2481]KEQ91755.1 hypothetical protein AUEXF2481DRAFT_450932 [Aureobasidium subglaciale EXF-2481]